MKVKTMNCDTAARIIGKGTQYVREGLKQQRLPFGSAVQKPDGKWSYNIIASKVYEYAGTRKESENK